MMTALLLKLKSNIMKPHKYTTIFSSAIKPLVPEDKDKYLAMASLLEISDFIPEIDTSKDVDLLPVAFNACVANRVNKNGDVIDTPTALAMYNNFINKPINIEHNREKVVGVILSAGFSEFGTDRSLSAEQIQENNSPFNITLGGVIWKVVNSELTDIIENSSDPTSDDYLKVSASWELGFSEYNIVVLAGEEKNIESAEIISEIEKIDELKSSLKSFGGSGQLEDGRSIYRQVINDVVPLGIGLTETPAADVKVVATATQKDNEESAKKDLNEKENSSQLEENNVTSLKKTENIIMEKINKVQDIQDESLVAGELKASVIVDFIENQLQEASEQYAGKQTEVQDKLKAAEEEHLNLVKDHDGLKGEMEAMKQELDTIKAEQAAQLAEARFNQRMTHFDEEYELLEEHRQVIATDIKDMSNEDFDSYSKKMEVLLSRNKYGGNKGDTPDADRKKKGHYGPGQKKKETADEEGEEDDKKLPPWLNKKKKSKAADEAAEIVEEETPAATLDQVMADAEVQTVAEIPTTIEATEPTVYDRYKSAFNVDQFEINQ
jgi:hypothetical protein